MDTTTTEPEIQVPPTTESKNPSAGGRLSELSKQLRLLQLQNQTQNTEIDRLERQLKLLADLKGISVDKLRSTLRSACESEAQYELRSQLQRLQLQLEAAQLKQHTSSSSSSHNHSTAALELRIGELEELQERQSLELKDLYRQLEESQETNTRLEAQVAGQNEQLRDASVTNTQLQKDLKVLAERLQEQEQEVKKEEPTLVAVEPTPIPLDETDDEVADITIDDVFDNDFDDELRSLLRDANERANSAETEVAVLRQKLQLSGEQLFAINEQTKLRNSQFQARLLVQAESIKDLEQQLVSLYTAFGVLDEEQQDEDRTRRLLQHNLDEADAKLARQLQDEQEPPPAASPGSPVHVLGGILLVKLKNGLRKPFKHQHVKLSSTLTHHILDIGKDASLILEFGVARVEPHHKLPFGLAILAKEGQPPVYVAATNPEDYEMWMNALLGATTGESMAKPNEDDGGMLLLDNKPFNADEEEDSRILT